MKNPFKRLTKFEWALWLCSLLTVALSFLFGPEKDILSLAASLLGVTALIFVAKGMVFGQVLCVVFALVYGVVEVQLGAESCQPKMKSAGQQPLVPSRT